MARKIGDFYINKYGVKIPVAAVEQFRKNIAAINKRAYRQEKSFAKLERKIDNVVTGQKLGQLMQMGYSPELIYARRSANLNQFQTIEQFNKRTQSAKKALKPNYIESRVKDYKRNYIKGLNREYGDEAKPLINKIRSMPLNDFLTMVVENPDQLTIRAVYNRLGRKTENLYELATAWGAKKAAEIYEQDLEI